MRVRCGVRPLLFANGLCSFFSCCLCCCCCCCYLLLLLCHCLLLLDCCCCLLLLPGLHCDSPVRVRPRCSPWASCRCLIPLPPTPKLWCCLPHASWRSRPRRYTMAVGFSMYGVFFAVWTEPMHRTWVHCGVFCFCCMDGIYYIGRA